MDQNLELAAPELRNPFEQPSHPTSTGRDVAEREGYPESGAQGFALATLEFIASAARDDALAPQLHERLTALLGHYEAMARSARPDNETLPISDVGKLLAALDQGAGLILLSGGTIPDVSVFTTGMRRLIDPWRSVAEE